MNFKEHFIKVLEEQDKPKKNLDEYNEMLLQNGWKRIGAGSYGVVYEKQGLNYVIKVYINDPSYSAYLDFILENQNDPHLPKIRKVFVPYGSVSDGVEYGAVAIEKLKPVQRINWRFSLVYRLKNAMVNIGVHNLSFEEFLEKVQKETKNNLLETIQNLTSKINTINYTKQLRRLDYFIESNLPLLKSFYKLKKFLEEMNLEVYFDLHQGNFMIRPSTGEIIITDPIA